MSTIIILTYLLACSSSCGDTVYRYNDASKHYRQWISLSF